MQTSQSGRWKGVQALAAWTILDPERYGKARREGHGRETRDNWRKLRGSTRQSFQQGMAFVVKTSALILFRIIPLRLPLGCKHIKQAIRLQHLAGILHYRISL